MINWKLYSVSSVLPVTLADAKIWLKIDSDSTEDSLITSLIRAAVNDFETYCNRAVRDQTIEMTFDKFEEFDLMRSPVRSITSITYYDSNNALQTLAATVYSLDTWALPNKIRLKYDQSWPDTNGLPGCIKVTYTAGYALTEGAYTTIPDSILTILKVMVRDYYKNRDNPNRRFTTMVERMLEFHKIGRFV